MKVFQAIFAFGLLEQILCAGVLHGEDGPVDLNNEEFCTDVSQYSDKYYEEGKEQCCTTMYVPNCEKKVKKVCMDVVNTICKPFVSPANDVKLEKNPDSDGGKPTKAVLEDDFVDLFECKPKDVLVTHTKLVPECKNVTNLNCETGWKVVNGNKVWSGEEDCEEVTWQDCQLVEKEVPFHAIESQCGPANPPRESFATCANKTVDLDVPTTPVEFVEGTKCTPEKKRECLDVVYNDCSKPVRTEACSEVDVRKPKQDFIHKKKCLLPSDIDRLTGGR